MALTPNEIINKEFDTSFRGYNVDQVNDYLDIIVAEFERLIQENNRLTQELSVATEKNEYFAQLQESLNSSIVVAQEAADRLKQNARKEAELILYEAERDADSRVAEASEYAQSIMTEVEALRNSSQTYRQNLERTIRKQLDLVTSEEYLALFDHKSTVKQGKVAQSSESDLQEKTHARVEALTQENESDIQKDNQINHPYAESTTSQTEESLTEVEVEDQGFVVDEHGDALSVEETVNIGDSISAEDESNQSDTKAEEETDSIIGETIRIEIPKSKR